MSVSSRFNPSAPSFTPGVPPSGTSTSPSLRPAAQPPSTEAPPQPLATIDTDGTTVPPSAQAPPAPAKKLNAGAPSFNPGAPSFTPRGNAAISVAPSVSAQKPAPLHSTPQPFPSGNYAGHPNQGRGLIQQQHIAPGQIPGGVQLPHPSQQMHPHTIATFNSGMPAPAVLMDASSAFGASTVGYVSVGDRGRVAPYYAQQQLNMRPITAPNGQVVYAIPPGQLLFNPAGTMPVVFTPAQNVMTNVSMMQPTAAPQPRPSVTAVTASISNLASQSAPASMVVSGATTPAVAPPSTPVAATTAPSPVASPAPTFASVPVHVLPATSVSPAIVAPHATNPGAAAPSLVAPVAVHMQAQLQAQGPGQGQGQGQQQSSSASTSVSSQTQSQPQTQAQAEAHHHAQTLASTQAQAQTGGQSSVSAVVQGPLLSTQASNGQTQAHPAVQSQSATAAADKTKVTNGAAAGGTTASGQGANAPTVPLTLQVSNTTACSAVKAAIAVPSATLADQQLEDEIALVKKELAQRITRIAELEKKSPKVAGAKTALLSPSVALSQGARPNSALAFASVEITQTQSGGGSRTAVSKEVVSARKYTQKEMMDLKPERIALSDLPQELQNAVQYIHDLLISGQPIARLGLQSRVGGSQWRGAAGGAAQSSKFRDARDVRGGRGGRGPRRAGGDTPLDIEFKPLAQSDNRYIIKRDIEGDERKLRDLQSVLNKLTDSNFERLTEQALKLNIDNEELMKRAVEAVFVKAIGEPAFSRTYASFCQRLSKVQLPNSQGTMGPDGSETRTFRHMIVTLLQDSFENRGPTADGESANIENAARKKRILGTMRFVGELYIRQMVQGRVMMYCISTLLESDKPDKNPVEEDLEVLCKLLTTVGATLFAVSKFKEPLEAAFAQLKALSQDKVRVSSRLRFLIMGVIDLKENGWAERRPEDRARGGASRPAPVPDIKTNTTDRYKRAGASTTNVAGGAGGGANVRVGPTPKSPPGGRQNRQDRGGERDNNNKDREKDKEREREKEKEKDNKDGREVRESPASPAPDEQWNTMPVKKPGKVGGAGTRGGVPTTPTQAGGQDSRSSSQSRGVDTDRSTLAGGAAPANGNPAVDREAAKSPSAESGAQQLPTSASKGAPSSTAGGDVTAPQSAGAVSGGDERKIGVAAGEAVAEEVDDASVDDEVLLDTIRKALKTFFNDDGDIIEALTQLAELPSRRMNHHILIEAFMTAIELDDAARDNLNRLLGSLATDDVGDRRTVLDRAIVAQVYPHLFGLIGDWLLDAPRAFDYLASALGSLLEVEVTSITDMTTADCEVLSEVGKAHKPKIVDFFGQILLQLRIQREEKDSATALESVRAEAKAANLAEFVHKVTQIPTAQIEDVWNTKCFGPSVS